MTLASFFHHVLPNPNNCAYTSSFFSSLPISGLPFSHPKPKWSQEMCLAFSSLKLPDYSSKTFDQQPHLLCLYRGHPTSPWSSSVSFQGHPSASLMSRSPFSFLPHCLHPVDAVQDQSWPSSQHPSFPASQTLPLLWLSNSFGLGASLPHTCTVMPLYCVLILQIAYQTSWTQ